MYGFVPDIDVANSPSSNTVAMLKSVTCACPKQNNKPIIAASTSNRDRAIEQRSI